MPSEKEVATTEVRVEATVVATGIYATPVHIRVSVNLLSRYVCSEGADL